MKACDLPKLAEGLNPEEEKSEASRQRIADEKGIYAVQFPTRRLLGNCLTQARVLKRQMR